MNILLNVDYIFLNRTVSPVNKIANKENINETIYNFAAINKQLCNCSQLDDMATVCRSPQNW